MSGSGPASRPWEGGHDTPAHEVYDPATDTWTARAPLRTLRDHFAAAAVGGRIYAIGGRIDGNHARNLDVNEEYDPAADTWRSRKPILTARSGIAAAVLDGKIMVFGGEAPAGTFDEVESYDPLVDRWIRYTPMPTARHGLGAAAVAGRIYVISGGKRPGGPVSSVNEIFARQEDGFESLFNGKDFSGIKFYLRDEKDPSKTFSVKDGAIICTGRSVGYWYTEKKYKEFPLRFDWRFKRPAGLKKDEDFRGNSGYLLWVNEHKVWPYTLETQGMNRYAGYIYFIDQKDKGKNKFKYDNEARKKAMKPVGEWNTYEIVAKGDTVVVTINEIKITTVTSHEYEKNGHIGFQSEGAEIHWKNIRIKPE